MPASALRWTLITYGLAALSILSGLTLLGWPFPMPVAIAPALLIGTTAIWAVSVVLGLARHRWHGLFSVLPAPAVLFTPWLILALQNVEIGPGNGL